MEKLERINKRLGWILVIGILVTQFVYTLVLFKSGGMAILIALLLGVLFFPFFITAISSVLNRERHLSKIKVGITIGILFQIALPVGLTFLFDREFIYLSLVGFLFGAIMWYFREKIEIQLLILNGIGAVLWLFVSFVGLLSS